MPDGISAKWRRTMFLANRVKSAKSWTHRCTREREARGKERWRAGSLVNRADFSQVAGETANKSVVEIVVIEDRALFNRPHSESYKAHSGPPAATCLFHPRCQLQCSRVKTRGSNPLPFIQPVSFQSLHLEHTRVEAEVIFVFSLEVEHSFHHQNFGILRKHFLVFIEFVLSDHHSHKIQIMSCQKLARSRIFFLLRRRISSIGHHVLDIIMQHVSQLLCLLAKRLFGQRTE